VARAPDLDCDAIALGLQQVAQQKVGFGAVLRANQFAESQAPAMGDAPVEGPLEGRVHLHNHSRGTATGYGQG